MLASAWCRMLESGDHATLARSLTPSGSAAATCSAFCVKHFSPRINLSACLAKSRSTPHASAIRSGSSPAGRSSAQPAFGRITEAATMTLRYAVGIKIGNRADQMTVEAEDALIAALKVKTAHPEAAITYVRKRNARGDRRHPHSTQIGPGVSSLSEQLRERDRQRRRPGASGIPISVSSMMLLLRTATSCRNSSAATLSTIAGMPARVCLTARRKPSRAGSGRARRGFLRENLALREGRACRAASAGHRTA